LPMSEYSATFARCQFGEKNSKDKVRYQPPKGRKPGDSPGSVRNADRQLEKEEKKSPEEGGELTGTRRLGEERSSP